MQTTNRPPTCASARSTALLALLAAILMLLASPGRVEAAFLETSELMASIDEWLNAAEYILAQGNPDVILCERGIRTFETATRNTLDLSAIPVLRERTHLPILVDPSHAVGHRRWVLPMARTLNLLANRARFTSWAAATKEGSRMTRSIA